MNKESKTLYEKIRLFLTVYMPRQRGLSEHTVRSYKQGINQFLIFICSKYNIRYDEISFYHWNTTTINEFLVYLENERNVSPSSRNQRLFALRSFLKYAGISDPELTSLSIQASGIPPAKEKKKPVPFLNEIAMETLLRQPDITTKTGFRNMCFMVMMYDTAARDCEMLNLRLESLDLNGSCPKVRLEGKGNKVREVPLMKKTVSHLKRYLQSFHSSESKGTDWLFYTVSHGQKTKMSDDNVARFLKKYSVMAKKECPEITNFVTPHQFRHSRAMHLYRHGMPLQLLAEFMGHASIISTQVYAYADTEMKRKAIEKYQGKQEEESLPEWRNDEELIRKLYGLA